MDYEPILVMTRKTLSTNSVKVRLSKIGNGFIACMTFEHLRAVLGEVAKTPKVANRLDKRLDWEDLKFVTSFHD